MIYLKWLSFIFGIIILFIVLGCIIVFMAKKFSKILLNPIFLTFILIISAILFSIILVGIFAMY